MLNSVALPLGLPKQDPHSPIQMRHSGGYVPRLGLEIFSKTLFTEIIKRMKTKGPLLAPIRQEYFYIDIDLSEAKNSKTPEVYFIISALLEDKETQSRLVDKIEWSHWCDLRNALLKKYPPEIKNPIIYLDEAKAPLHLGVVTDINFLLLQTSINPLDHIVQSGFFKGLNLIHIAILHGKNKLAKNFIKQNPPVMAQQAVNAPNAFFHGSTPLYLAIYANNIEMVFYLIEECGVDPFVPIAEGLAKGLDLFHFSIKLKKPAIALLMMAQKLQRHPESTIDHRWLLDSSPIHMPATKIHGLSILGCAVYLGKLNLVQYMMNELKLDAFTPMSEGLFKGFNAFHIAIKLNITDIILFIIEHTTTLEKLQISIGNGTQWVGFSPLHLIAYEGDLIVFKHFLEKYRIHAEICAKKLISLHKAIQDNHREIISYWMDDSPSLLLKSINLRDKPYYSNDFSEMKFRKELHGLTPLGCAIYRKHCSIFSYFISELKMDPFVPMVDGCFKGLSVFHLALNMKWPEIVFFVMMQYKQRILEILQIPVSAEGYSQRWSGYSLLYLIICYSELHIIENFIENYNIDPATLIIDGKAKGLNLLHAAIMNDDAWEIIRYLVARKPSLLSTPINASEGPYHGLTYLGYAIYEGASRYTCEYLINHCKFNPFIPMSAGEYKGLNAFHMAIKYKKDIALSIMEHKEITLENLQIPAEKGCTYTGCHPIYLAACVGYFEVVKTLIEKYHIDPAILVLEGEHKGLTSLHGAIRNGNLKIISYIIDHTPSLLLKSINCPDSIFHGLTPLGFAVYVSAFKSFKHLLQDSLPTWNSKKSSVNFCIFKHTIDPFIPMPEGEFKGFNSFHIAIKTNNLDFVKYFVEEFNVNLFTGIGIKNSLSYRTPLGLATRKGDEAVYRYLKQAIDNYKKKSPHFPQPIEEKLPKINIPIEKQFYQACKTGNLENVLYFVLQQRRQPRKKSSSNEILFKGLNKACNAKQVEVTLYLLEEVVWDKFELKDVLILAIKKNSIDVIEKLFSLKNMLLPSNKNELLSLTENADIQSLIKAKYPSSTSSSSALTKSEEVLKSTVTERKIELQQIKDEEKPDTIQILAEEFAKNKKEIDFLKIVVELIQPQIESIPSLQNKDFNKKLTEITLYLQELAAHENEINNLTKRKSVQSIGPVRKKILGSLKKMTKYFDEIHTLWKNVAEFIRTEDSIDILAAEDLPKPKLKPTELKKNLLSSSSASHFHLPRKVEAKQAVFFNDKINKLIAVRLEELSHPVVLRAIRIDILRRLLLEFLKNLPHLTGYRTLRNGLVHCTGIAGIDAFERVDESSVETEAFIQLEEQLISLCRSLVGYFEIANETKRTPVEQLPLYTELCQAAAREEKFTLEERLEIAERMKARLVLYTKVVETLPPHHIFHRLLYLAQDMVNIRGMLSREKRNALCHVKKL